MWNDNAGCGCGYDIYGHRVAPDGTTVDPLASPIVISSPGSQATMQALPAVAFDGEKYLVTWSDARGSVAPTDPPCPTGFDCFKCTAAPCIEVYGRFVSPEGQPLRSTTSADEFLVASGMWDKMRPTLSYGGGKYLITWNAFGFFSVPGTPPWEVWWGLVSP